MSPSLTRARHKSWVRDQRSLQHMTEHLPQTNVTAGKRWLEQLLRKHSAVAICSHRATQLVCTASIGSERASERACQLCKLVVYASYQLTTNLNSGPLCIEYLSNESSAQTLELRLLDHPLSARTGSVWWTSGCTRVQRRAANLLVLSLSAAKSQKKKSNPFVVFSLLEGSCDPVSLLVRWPQK